MQVTLEGSREDSVPGSPCINHLEKPQIILTSKDYLTQRKAEIKKKLNSSLRRRDAWADRSSWARMWRQKFLKLMLSKAPAATPRSCLKLFTPRGETPIDLHSAPVCFYKAVMFQRITSHCEKFLIVLRAAAPKLRRQTFSSIWVKSWEEVQMELVWELWGRGPHSPPPGTDCRCLLGPPTEDLGAS